MRVYIVRHGLSVGNKERTHQLPNTALSEEGILQAKAIALRVAKLPIDLIYASSLKRAQQTAQIIAKRVGLKIETWDEIREIKRPSEITGRHVDSPEARMYAQALETNFGDPDWKYSDEDSFGDLKGRANKVLKHLCKNHKNQNILLVSHGTFIKMAIASAVFGQNLTPQIFWDFRIHTYAENTGISVLDYSEGRGWKLLTFNDSSHL